MYLERPDKVRNGILMQRGMEMERSELGDIIVYLTSKMRYLTEIRLVKSIFAADIYHIEKFAKRLTDVQFTKYRHGVWSPQIVNEATLMDGSDILVEIKETPDKHEATFFKPIRDKVFTNLSGEKISTLEDVVEEWKYKPTNELIDFTKSTIPYRRAKFGEVLDLDRYVKLMNQICGDEELIKAVERSREQAKQGKGKIFINKKELEEYYDAL
jgi:putative ubiquitin-RnfH superfamily antitoxin RatB of RatAB toxin-antitoxin module